MRAPVGVFFVPDAPGAQEFVREHGVKTVFGLSGTFGDGTVFTLLVFTRESLDNETVDAFTHLIALIKADTADLVRQGALFA